MTKDVEFYYGIGSRYSFLASTRMDALEQETGCTVVWRPLYSGALMVKRGMHPFRQGSLPSGQYDWRYRRYDAECWAAYYGIKYFEPKDGVMEYEHYGLACVAAERLNAGAAFSKAMFDAVFAEGQNELGDDALKAVADKAGLNGDALVAMIDEEETAALHEKNVDDAIAAGAFGVPSFVCDGRLFWGNDRIVLLKDFLTCDDPDAYPLRNP
jgi:2-hydroxychromene-2-carboxylate isomerase